MFTILNGIKQYKKNWTLEQTAISQYKRDYKISQVKSVCQQVLRYLRISSPQYAQLQPASVKTGRLGLYWSIYMEPTTHRGESPMPFFTLIYLPTRPACICVRLNQWAQSPALKVNKISSLIHSLSNFLTSIAWLVVLVVGIFINCYFSVNW